MYKICALTKHSTNIKTEKAIKDLDTLVTKHMDILHQLVLTSNADKIKELFRLHFNEIITTDTENLETRLYLFLFHSLKSIIDCSDVVLYHVECDQIFGEIQDKYLWIRTLFSDPHHSSRFETNVVNLGTEGNKLELLNIFLIEGSEDFNFKKEIVEIKMEDGVMYVELPEVMDINGKVIKTKKVEISGNSGNILVRLPITAQKAFMLEELNNPNSPYSVATDLNGKPTAIHFRVAPKDISSAKRSLHSVNIQRVIGLLTARGEQTLLPELYSALFSEGMMLEVTREQEFNGVAGRSIIALAHNVNYNIDHIIPLLSKGKEIKIKDGIIYLDGKPLELLNHNKELFKAKTDASLRIIQEIQTLLRQNKLKKITAQAESCETNKANYIKKEKQKLNSTPLRDLQICYFEPIPIATIIKLVKLERKTEFMEFIKKNKMLTITNEGAYLDIQTLSNRSLLLNSFFHGYPPKNIESLLQPKLRGKAICKPYIDDKGTIQTKVIIIFDKPIHKPIQELLSPIYIRDELSAEKTFLDPKLDLNVNSINKVPSFKKSEDGTTIELILNYDIWSYPNRKIFFRFSKGTENTFEYEDNGTKIATDVPNILLSGTQITTVKNTETEIMEFFETIMKTRKYETQLNKEPDEKSVLGKCMLIHKYKRKMLTYFIRNHIDDPNALQLEPMLLRILFRYLIIDIDDAIFALRQIQGYKDIASLKDNSFYKAIELSIKNRGATFVRTY